MPQSYIPDENVIILAQKQEDDHNKPNLTCFLLIQKILENPTARIIVDEAIWDQYWTQAQKHQFHAARRHILLELTKEMGPPDPDDGSWPHKVTLLPNAPSFPEETRIPAGSQDDLIFVRLAVQTGAALVTTDRPMREGLQAAGITQRYGLIVLSPKAALRHFPEEN